MLMQDWTRVISTSVVPVAIISASALLCLAFYNRLASIVSRLRGFQRERLHEFQAYNEHVRSGREDGSSIRQHQQVLEMLQVQTTRVYRRAKMIRSALLCLLGAIACLTLCSLCLGHMMLMAAVSNWAGYAAEGFFMAGMALLLAGTMLGFGELWNALDPVHLESQFVTKLSRELEGASLKDTRVSSRPESTTRQKDDGDAGPQSTAVSL